MARQLWVLRHAEAEPHGAVADAVRRLTAHGEDQARIAGAAFARMGATFELVLFSPKERARRTAELVAEQLNGAAAELREHDPLAEGFAADAALGALDEVGRDARLLVVGHEPDLSSVVRELVGGGDVDLKKGGLAVVRLTGVRGELAVLMRPRELALIADAPILAS
ncbi:MAG TPA: phosphohistidine phosphatase SixA [Solirubrobacteraceae bacterium]|nr:phosphohistidine phosphatase SixA [Solirubrobacteraceae bacterium]